MKVGDIIRWKAYDYSCNKKKYHIGIVTGSKKIAGGEMFNVYVEGEMFKITEWLIKIMDKCEILFGLDDESR